MMGRIARVAATATLLTTTACFHQVVQSGLTAGPKTVTKPWVSTWIFGLVPAKPIDVRADCPSGVASIATQQSFANGLVAMLTIGIWDPQTVTITCAAGRAMLPATTPVFVIESSATPSEQDAALGRAINWSIAHHSDVAVAY